MAITAKMVKELREMTGAGMMECKKALTEADGDVDTANDILRKRGLKIADKKSARNTNEGLIGVMVSSDSVGLAEVNCETDFVALNDTFQDFVREVTHRKLNDIPLPEDTSDIVAVLGENIKIGRHFAMDADDNETISTYIHGVAGENVGRIGVAVIHTGDDALGKQIAMHIAASNPKAIAVEDLDPEFVANERRLFTEQAEESGKPANIIEKMVEGRMQKALREVTLSEQPFVIDPDITVGKVLKEANAEVISFIRIAIGE